MMNGLKFYKKNYLLLILFLSVFMVLHFPTAIRAESQGGATSERAAPVAEATGGSIENTPAEAPAQKAKEAVSSEQAAEPVASEEPANAPVSEAPADAVSEEAVAPKADALPSETSDSALATDPAKDETEKKDDALKNDDESKASPDKDASKDETKPADVLKQGEVLEVDALAKEPMALGSGNETPQTTIKVDSFEKLKKAIEDAGNKPTVIEITKSFTLTEALTIGKDQDITLTANNERKEDPWKPIDQPANHAGEGEAKQREIIE